MVADLLQIKPRRKRSMRAQITDAVRDMVLRQQLTPGTRLPSTQELATEWGVQVPTVHQALTPLVKEGLLERTPRVGTFVRERTARLTRVAIYAAGKTWDVPAYAFGRVLCRVLGERLNAKDIAQTIFVDPRGPKAQNQTWDELARAAGERRFDVLVVPEIDLPKIDWMEALAVPVVYFSDNRMPNSVYLDEAQWISESMRLLAEQGCKRVGVISSRKRLAQHLDGSALRSHQFDEMVHAAAAASDLELRPDWFLRPGGEFFNTGSNLPAFGYESLQSLWQLRQRPDGVIVHDDVTANGVLMAAMAEQIQIPDELKLVLHRNHEVGLFCPVPASYMDVHVTNIAEALIAQAQRLYAGAEMAAVGVPYHPVSCSVKAT